MVAATDGATAGLRGVVAPDEADVAAHAAGGAAVVAVIGLDEPG